MKLIRRLMVILITLIMTITISGINSVEVKGDEMLVYWTHFGSGGNVEWAIDSDGTLWLRPENGATDGQMGAITTPITNKARAPWSSYTSMSGQTTYIKSVKIEENTTIKSVKTPTFLFAGIGSLENAGTIDLRGFDTSEATNMSHMFYDSQASTIDLSSFNTSKVTNMSSMFNGSQATTIKGLNNFDTKNVTDMSYMFYKSQVTTITGLDNFDTSNVTNMDSMFTGSTVTELDLSSFVVKNNCNISDNKDDYIYLFYGMSNIETLKLGEFDLTNKNIDRMFKDLHNLEVLDVSNVNFTGVVTPQTALDGDTKLQKLILPSNLGGGNNQATILNTSALDDTSWIKTADKNGSQMPFDENNIFDISQFRQLGRTGGEQLAGTWVKVEVENYIVLIEDDSSENGNKGDMILIQPIDPESIGLGPVVTTAQDITGKLYTGRFVALSKFIQEQKKAANGTTSAMHNNFKSNARNFYAAGRYKYEIPNLLFYDLQNLAKVDLRNSIINPETDYNRLFDATLGLKTIVFDEDSIFPQGNTKLAKTWVKKLNKDGNFTLDETEYTAAQLQGLNESTTPALSGTWTAYRAEYEAKGTTLWATDDPDEKIIAYCFANHVSSPTGAYDRYLATDQSMIDLNMYDIGYEHPQPVADTLREALITMMYYGYPNDPLGLQQKYGLTDNEAYLMTRLCIWYVSDGIDPDSHGGWWNQRRFQNYRNELLSQRFENIEDEYDLYLFVSHGGTAQNMVALRSIQRVDIGGIKIYKEGVIDEISTYVPNVEFTIYDSNNQVVKVLTTNNSGYAILNASDEDNGLAPGRYTVRETNCPDEWKLSQDVFTVDVVGGEIAKYGYRNNETVLSELEFTDAYEKDDDIEKAGLAVYKQARDGTPIGGAVFGIYDSNNELVMTLITNSDGYAETSRTALPLGVYTINEISAPGMWVNDTPAQTADLNQHLAFPSFTFKNLSKGVDITLGGTKQLSGMDGSLEGYVFVLKDDEGNEISRTTSNASGEFTFPAFNLGGKNALGPNSFTIEEVPGNNPNMNYDTHIEFVTVILDDVAPDSELEVTILYDNDGAVFTNTPKDRLYLSGYKKWIDPENEDKRPESITVHLIDETGEIIESKVVTADDNWSYSFVADRYDNLGNEKSYHVDEEPVPGYKKMLDGMNLLNIKSDEPEIKKFINKVYHELLPSVDSVFTYTLNIYIPKDVSDLEYADIEDVLPESVALKDKDQINSGKPNRGYWSKNSLVGDGSQQTDAQSLLIDTMNNFTFTYDQGEHKLKIHINENGLKYNAGRWLQFEYDATIKEHYRDISHFVHSDDYDDLRENPGDVCSPLKGPCNGAVNDSTYYYQPRNMEKQYTISNKVTVMIPATYEISVSKLLTGADISDPSFNGLFSFELYEGEKLLQTIQNTGGSAKFAAVTIQPGYSRVFKVKEVQGNDSRITYDGTEYTVTVSANESGQATALINDSIYNRIEFENKFTPPTPEFPVEISKIDATTRKELPGASLEIRDEAGELIASWVSSDNPKQFNLEPGTYFLEETRAPKGYEIARRVKFIVDSNTSDLEKYVVTMEDIPKPQETSDKYYQTFKINKTWFGDSETGRPQSVLFHVVDENNQSVTDITLTKDENWSKVVNIPLDDNTLKDLYIYEDPVDGYISDATYIGKKKLDSILVGEYLLNENVVPSNNIGSTNTSGLDNVPMGSVLIDDNLPLSEAIMDLPDGFIFEKDVTVIRSMGTSYESDKADRIIYTGQLPYNKGEWITLTWKDKAKDILTGNTFDLTLNIKVSSIEAATDVDGREINIITYQDSMLHYMSYIVCRDSTSCKFSNNADNIVGVDLITKIELSSTEHEVPKYIQLYFSDIDLPDYMDAYKNNNGNSDNSYGTNFKYAEKIRIGNNTGLVSDIFLSGNDSQIESNGLIFAAKTGAPNLRYDEKASLTYLTKTDDVRFEWTGSFCGTTIFYDTENTIRGVKETNINNSKIRIDTTAIINGIESTETTPAKITINSNSSSTITVSDKVVITGLSDEQIEGCVLTTELYNLSNNKGYGTESTLDSTTNLINFTIPSEPGQYTFVNKLNCFGDLHHNGSRDDTKETFFIEKEPEEDPKYSISILKVNEDNQPLAGARFYLYNHDHQRIEAWTSTEQVVKINNLTPGIYYLEETIAPDGYEKITAEIEFIIDKNGNVALPPAVCTVCRVSAHHDQIVIKNVPKSIEKTQITVSKIWKDRNGIAIPWPADIDGITVTLNGSNGYSDSYTLTSISSSHTFTELNKTDDKGNLITYSVNEISIDEYTSKVEKLSDTEFKIINQHNPELRNITVNKVWNDSNNRDGFRPQSLTVTLTGSDGSSRNAILSKENDWTYEFVDLPVNLNGNPIIYEVTEPSIEPYTRLTDGYTLINTYTPEDIEITVNKIWNDEDNKDKLRPESITIRLFTNGTEVDSVTLTDQTSHTFTGLPKYKNAKLINYTVLEDSVDNYDSTVEGFTVTNSYTPEKTSYSVTKSWNDNNNQDGIRPGTVSVQLYANEEPIGEIVEIEESYTWHNLDLNKDGNPINYTVKEVNVPQGYTAAYEYKHGVTEIINSHTPEVVSFNVIKIWDDENNKHEERPETIQVVISGSDGSKHPLELSGSFEGSLSDLPKYKDGAEIVYGLEEVEVEGYKKSSVKLEGNTFTLTNARMPKETKVIVSKTSINSTDELPGATLEIFKGEEMIEQWISTENKHEVELTPGEYRLAEHIAPENYNIAEDIIFRVNDDFTVEIKNGENWVAVGEIQMKDAPLEIEVEISKQSINGTTELPGAELTVSGKNFLGEDVEISWTSSNTTKKIKLLPGSYTLTEIAPPDNFQIAESIDFTIDNQGNVISDFIVNGVIVMKDIPVEETVGPSEEFEVVISKVELGQGKELSGAELKVIGTDADNLDFAISWISGGEAKTLQLKPGTYTLIEDRAPLGYDIAESIKFAISESGEVSVNGSKVTKLVMEDKQLEHTIKVSKVNIAGEEIPGAKIQIKDSSGNLIHSWTSEKDKTHEFKLLPGDYIFHEEAAPNGYLAVSDIKFTVGLDGKISVQEVKGEVEYKNGVLVVTDKTKPSDPVTPTTPQPSQPAKQDVKTAAGDIVLIVTLVCLISIFLLLTIFRKKQTKKAL